MRNLWLILIKVPNLVAEAQYHPAQDISVHLNVVMLHITDNRTSQTQV